MSTWLELRCTFNSDNCWSHQNNGPKQMSDDDHRSVLRALHDLAQEAREQGWKYTRVGWKCPGCAKKK